MVTKKIKVISRVQTQQGGTLHPINIIFSCVPRSKMNELCLTEEQTSVFKEIFSTFSTPDKYGRESIPAKEIETVLLCVGVTPTKDDLSEIVGDLGIDDNKDGKITIDEFLTIMEKRMKQGSKEEKLQETFRIFDKNENGYISRTELRNIMINLGERMTDKEIEDMIKVADDENNNDGKITYEQFLKVTEQTL